MIIFLIGMPGVGKTTIGAQLAKTISYQFIDLDEEIESKVKSSISELIEKEGEEKFREIEKRILLNVLTHKNVIIATGGGTPCFFDNLSLMKTKGVVIYLKANPKEIYDRLTQQEIAKRPLLRNGFLDLEELIEKRKEQYEKAHHTVEVMNNNYLQKIINLLS